MCPLALNRILPPPPSLTPPPHTHQAAAVGQRLLRTADYIIRLDSLHSCLKPVRDQYADYAAFLHLQKVSRFDPRHVCALCVRARLPMCARVCVCARLCVRESTRFRADADCWAPRPGVEIRGTRDLYP